MFLGLALDSKAIDRLYPFHLVLDGRGHVVGAGRVLARLLPELAAAPSFFDVFAIERPHGIVDFDSLCRAHDTSFLIGARSRPEVRLKGEVMPAPGQPYAVLFAVLWFTDSTTLDTLGLSISDFALSDASSDYVFLTETQAALLRNADVLSERLKIARDEAIAASRLKSEFLANMSHELRTPLNAIIGFSEYLMAVGAKDLAAKHLDYIKDIHGSGRFLLDIINDLLDLSRIEAGKLVVEDATVDLGAVLDDVVRAVSEPAKAKALTIALNGFADPVHVRADLRLMRQVLLNLLSNAVKFNREGGAVDIAARVRPNGALAVSIADTGIGVDPAIIPELFQSFRQANSTIARDYGGTGLGLAIVRQLMLLHGGDVGMESAAGVGTTVTITLPPARCLAGESAPARAPRAAG
jgi:signal transduction histidine kinase